MSSETQPTPTKKILTIADKPAPASAVAQLAIATLGEAAESLRPVMRHLATVADAAGKHDTAAVLAALRDATKGCETIADAIGSAVATIDKLAQYLSELEKSAAAMASDQAKPKPKGLHSGEEKRFCEDACHRINRATCEQIGRRVKHADDDRPRFDDWLKSYLSENGQCAKYAKRVTTAIFGEDGAARIATQFCQSTAQQFDRATDPAEALTEWKSIGPDYAMIACDNEAYDRGVERIKRGLPPRE